MGTSTWRTLCCGGSRILRVKGKEEELILEGFNASTEQFYKVV